MGALFGKAKRPRSRVTEQDKAILQLKQQRDKLRQYQKRIERSLEVDRELAKKCLQQGRKERAKLLLRKKKYQEKLIANTDSQLENLERLASDLEFAQVELQVLDGLKIGNAALSKVHEILAIDEIERVLDETKEGIEKQQEIDAMLIGALTDSDENDVLAELNALVYENKDTNEASPLNNENIDIQLPNVPSEEPQKLKISKTKEKESELLAA